MATVRGAIQLIDGMTPVFRSMQKALSIVLDSFESLQRASSKAIDTSNIAAAREELNHAASAMDELKNKIDDSKKSTKELPDHFKQASNAANDLLSRAKSIAGALGSIWAVKKVIELSDELTQTNARLNLIKNNGKSVVDLQNMIFGAAQRSRSDYQQIADMVSKIGLNAKAAFNSNEEMVAFAEILNKQYAIAGTSAEGAAAANLQITQALGSGVLRGEELNSVFEQAPTIIQAIAEYLDVDVGKIREMAQEGLITAEVFKNAMFASAESVNQQFENMPMTLGQIWTSIKNQALFAFQPILEKINEFANSEQFQVMVQRLIAGIQQLAIIAIQAFNIMINGMNLVIQNWSWLEPLIWIVVGALLGYKIATLVGAAVNLIMAISEAKKKKAQEDSTKATFHATVVQYGLNTAMLACPLTWIVIGIMAVIAVIIWLANKVGGFKVLWNYAWAAIQVGFLYAKAVIESGFYWMVWGLLWAGDKLVYGWEEIKKFAFLIFTAIANFFTSIGAGIMSGLQNLLNGAIDLLNGFLKGMNWLLGWMGIDIGLIEHVTFGDDAQESAKKKIAEREAAYQDYVNQIEQDRAGRQDVLNGVQEKAKSAWSDNVAEAAKVWQDAKAFEAEEKARKAEENKETASQDDLWSSIDTGVAQTAENTGSISSSINATQEDLKYLREMAERETINRFTTAEIRIDMTNHNQIAGGQDVDGIVELLNEKLEEAMNTAAEGVYA